MELIDKQKLLEWISENGFGVKSLDYSLTSFRDCLIEQIESGTFDGHTAQEDIDKLKKELNVSNLAHEQAERDFEKWKARAIQAESDKRDSMVSLLKGDRLIEELWRDLGQAEQDRNELLEGLKWYAENIEERGQHGYKARSIIAKIEGK